LGGVPILSPGGVFPFERKKGCCVPSTTKACGQELMHHITGGRYEQTGRIYSMA
jgi:hypothetical protein